MDVYFTPAHTHTHTHRYIHYRSKVFGHPQKCFLLILKVLFLRNKLSTTIFLFIILDTNLPQ